jgi:membrane protein YdbS with pleckstrin-like domain
MEHYLEAGITPGAIGARVTFWFQGVEFWLNRLVGDTLTVILGWYVYTLKNSLSLPAKIFSALWMIVHLFVFPDSMYLHRLLFS